MLNEICKSIYDFLKGIDSFDIKEKRKIMLFFNSSFAFKIV